MKELKKITWKKGIKRLNFPCWEYDPIRAIKNVERMYNLPKYRLIGYEIRRHVGKDSFTTYPQVFIER